jgi:hypothetical protein
LAVAKNVDSGTALVTKANVAKFANPTQDVIFS